MTLNLKDIKFNFLKKSVRQLLINATTALEEYSMYGELNQRIISHFANEDTPTNKDVERNNLIAEIESIEELGNKGFRISAPMSLGCLAEVLFILNLCFIHRSSKFQSLHTNLEDSDRHWYKIAYVMNTLDNQVVIYLREFLSNKRSEAELISIFDFVYQNIEGIEYIPNRILTSSNTRNMVYPYLTHRTDSAYTHTPTKDFSKPYGLDLTGTLNFIRLLEHQESIATHHLTEGEQYARHRRLISLFEQRDAHETNEDVDYLAEDNSLIRNEQNYGSPLLLKSRINAVKKNLDYLNKKGLSISRITDIHDCELMVMLPVLSISQSRFKALIRLPYEVLNNLILRLNITYDTNYMIEWGVGNDNYQQQEYEQYFHSMSEIIEKTIDFDAKTLLDIHNKDVLFFREDHPVSPNPLLVLMRYEAARHGNEYTQTFGPNK